jgi:hypothetical protein
MKIYVFGTENKGDNLAIKVGKALEKAHTLGKDTEFIFCQEPTELLGEKSIVILDVVKGLKKPMLIPQDMLKARKLSTLHDFDLCFFLQLAKAAGMLGKLKIIGIPQKGSVAKIIMDVKKLI